MGMYQKTQAEIVLNNHEIYKSKEDILKAIEDN